MILPACCAAAIATDLKSCSIMLSFSSFFSHYNIGAMRLRRHSRMELLTSLMFSCYSKNVIRRAAPLLTLVMTITAVALADPYGPPYAVTDMAPFCARCHASAALTQLIDLPESAAAEESVEAKHLARIRKDAAYKDLSATDREALINAIKWMYKQS